MNKIVLALLIVLVSVVVIAQFVLPRAVEVMLEKKLTEIPDLYGVYDTTVEAHPPLKLILGKFDCISFSGANLSIGRLNVAKYTMSAVAGKVDLFKSFKEKSVVMQNQQLLKMSLYVTCDDFSSWLQEYFPSVSDFSVELGVNTVEIIGVVEAFGQNIPVCLKSRLLVTERGTILLTVEDFAAETEIDSKIFTKLEEIFSIEIDLRGTSPPTFINAVEIRETGIFIEATTTVSSDLIP